VSKPLIHIEIFQPCGLDALNTVVNTMIHPHSQVAEHRFLFLYNRGKLKLNDMYCSKYI